MNTLREILPVYPTMADAEVNALEAFFTEHRPDLIVESGTEKGGSACLFARHARVISIDMEDIHLGFKAPRVQLVRGHIPEILNERVSAMVKEETNWFYFHDSQHHWQVVMTEAEWAFEHGARAILWHDFQHVSELPQQMKSKHGWNGYRLCNAKYPFTGIGICWNPVTPFLPDNS